MKGTGLHVCAGFGIAHLLRVAVVGGDEEDVPEGKAVSSSAAS
jgi:hypothetical protein